MKNRLKKLLVASLSTACLFASNPISAMDRPEQKDPLGSSTLSASQNLSPSQIVISVSDLYQMFPPEQVEKMLSRGSLQNSGLSQSSLLLSPTEREFKRLVSNSDGVDLFPSVDPREIMHFFNIYLIPKYASQYQSNFKKSSLTNEEDDDGDLLDFLKANKNFIMSGALGDERSIVLLLKLITQTFDPYSYFSYPMHHYQPQNIHDTKGNMLLTQCAEISRRQLSIKLDVLYEGLESAIKSQYFHHVQHEHQEVERTKLLERLKKDLNSKLGYPGGEIDINHDAKEISKTIENWVKIGRQLVIFELKQWEHKGVLLANFERQVNFVTQQLLKATEKAPLYFSGVNISDYSVGLVQVPSGDGAKDPQELQKLVDAHKANYKEQLTLYDNFKSYKKVMEKFVNWIDDVFFEVSKKGRMS